MLPALLVALAWAPSLVGLGALVRHGADRALRPGVAGLLGLGIAGTAAAWLNLFVGVGPWIAAALWASGLVLLVARRRWLLEAFAPADLVPLVLVVAGASWAMRQPLFQYDTAYYHLQALAWTKAGPIPAGLANVHFRLGFNSLWTTAAAALEHPLAAGRSPSFLNQLPILFAGQLSLVALRRLAAGSRSFSNLLLAATVLPIASATFGVGGLYVDYTLALVVHVALALWAAAIEAGDRFGAEALAPALLSVLAALLKISSAPLALGGALLLVAHRRALPRRWWLHAGALSAAATLPWAARGLLTSGCLAFPVWATCVPALPWTVPEAKTRAVAAAIRAFAQMPGWTPDGSWVWLEEWPARILRHYPEAPLLAATAATGLLLWAIGPRRGSAAAAWVLAISAGGAAFWFSTAPEPRFGLGFLYALGLTPLLAAVAAREARLERRGVRLAAAAALVLAAAGLAIRLDGRPRTGTLFGLDPWRPPLLAWPELPRFAVRPITTAAGLLVHVPLEDECCGVEPIPCTPAPELDLRLRLDGGTYHLGAAAGPAGAAR